MTDLKNIDDLVRVLFPQEEEKSLEIEHTALINTALMKIVGIDVSLLPTGSEFKQVPISQEIAFNLLSGKETYDDYLISYYSNNNNNEFKIIKRDKIKQAVYHRVDTLPLVKLNENDKLDNPDVRIRIGKNYVIIHYNGDFINSQQIPTKLYFTDGRDPTFLIYSITLDYKTLSELAYRNNLEAWPNPISFTKSENLNLSIYTFRTNVKISLELEDETGNY